MSLWPLKMEAYSALGLSHSFGRRLGAKYGIPHGITSCLTLAPVVALLQASIPIPEHKKALSRALFYLKIESTGDDEEDIQLLAHAIEHLVIDLGLRTDLKAYNVPREDLQKIAMHRDYDYLTCREERRAPVDTRKEHAAFAQDKMLERTRLLA
ncbi:hypothetical protein ACEPAF_7167 [Sanghuangporus sanghuang]